MEESYMEPKGIIELSDTVMISDPCYGLDVWCQHVLRGVKPGKYNCYVSYFYDELWGPNYRRISSITIKHENYKTEPNKRLDHYCVGIDAGCCGIYDLDYYKQYHTSRDVQHSWYDTICDNIFPIFPNPDYITFEESEYFKQEFSYDYIESQDDANIRKKLYKQRMNAEKAYERDHSISCKTRESQDAYCRDNKCIISASAYGDGNAKVNIGKNSKNEIVSIKLSFK